MVRKKKDISPPPPPPKPKTKAEIEKEEKEQAELEALAAREDAKQREIEKIKAREDAKESILRFFADKDYYGGGPIPESELLCNKNLDFLTTTDWGTGYELAFSKLKIANKQVGDDPKTDKMIQDGVKKCLGIIEECNKLKIPTAYVTGIINLYLQYCEGLK